MLPNPAIFARILGRIVSVNSTWCDDGTSNDLLTSIATFFNNSKSENIGTLEDLIESEKLEITRKESQDARANEKPKKKIAAAKSVGQSADNEDGAKKRGSKTVLVDPRTLYNRTSKLQKSTGVFGDADALKGKGKGTRKGQIVATEVNGGQPKAAGPREVANASDAKPPSKSRSKKNLTGVQGASASNTARASTSVVTTPSLTPNAPKLTLTASSSMQNIALQTPPTNSSLIFNSDPIYEFVERQMASLHKLEMHREAHRKEIQGQNYEFTSSLQREEQAKEATSKQHRRNQNFLDAQAKNVNLQQALLSMGLMQQQQQMAMGMGIGVQQQQQMAMGMGMGMGMAMGVQQQQQQQQMAMGMGMGVHQQQQQQQQQQMAMGMMPMQQMAMGRFSPNQMAMMQQHQMQTSMMSGHSSNKKRKVATGGMTIMSPQQLGGMGVNLGVNLGMNMGMGMGMGMGMSNEIAQTGMASPAIVPTTKSRKVTKGNANEFPQNMSSFQQTPSYNPFSVMGVTPEQFGRDDNIYVSDVESDEDEQDGEVCSSSEEEDGASDDCEN